MQSASYRRREPERTILHQVVRDHLDEFLDRADTRSEGGRALPRYVKLALVRLRDCGVLEKGFARVRCPACGFDSAVGFS
ncbi:MAG TPA: hypothetical protein VK661_13610 [Planctomycetota bacterium]|nr:hypothetical protein [Planctomycetota bacterium]